MGVFVVTVFMLAVFLRSVFVVFVFVMFVFRVLVLAMYGITQSGGVFGGFVGGVGFEFGAVGGAVFLDFRGFCFGEFRFRGGLIFRCVEAGVLFFLSFFLGFFCFFFRELGIEGGLNIFDLFFVEFGATGESVGFGVIGSFLVLGLGQFERE
jgi:hypothetical protein